MGEHVALRGGSCIDFGAKPKMNQAHLVGHSETEFKFEANMTELS